ncbi:dynamin family protein [Kineosporia sp. J2-2]|uniref:Dynamin family protein n=1 Tax=Kineosporia corallincola TaxID=2835133 RepID=A0ABS5TE62_9ACTN|nr:dynamin family protein [Kineosporia corallincola]MBT0769351.1 dynamin family protein [Kineosporia corallincola]
MDRTGKPADTGGVVRAGAGAVAARAGQIVAGARSVFSTDQTEPVVGEPVPGEDPEATDQAGRARFAPPIQSSTPTGGPARARFASPAPVAADVAPEPRPRDMRSAEARMVAAGVRESASVAVGVPVEEPAVPSVTGAESEEVAAGPWFAPRIGRADSAPAGAGQTDGVDQDEHEVPVPTVGAGPAAEARPAVGASAGAVRAGAGRPAVRTGTGARSGVSAGASAATGPGRAASAAGRGAGGDAGTPGAVGSAPLPERLAAVARLRTQVATLPLTLDVEGIADVRREREDLLSQLDDYILPRLHRPDAPALAVIGGSTGAGKSTLTNSIVGREVSRSGVLRPTTRSPVLVHHPHDSGAFLSQRILPRLTRVTSEAPEPVQPIDPNAPRITGLRLVPYDGLAPGLAIIDAPDIDSLVETNRDLAVQLLQAADLWIFVTTAARYADATPWKMLKQAADRGAAIAVVLDRVPPEALQELRIHLATKLRDQGLGGAALFTVPESPLEDGYLPVQAVRPLRDWLRRIAGDERSRSVVVERTLAGAMRSLPSRARILAKAAAAQADGWSQLYEDTDAVMIPARVTLLDGLADGSLVSGQVLSHWQEFIARGDLAARLGGTSSGRAQRIGAAITQQETTEQSLTTTICEAVSATVHQAARSGLEQVVSTWRGHVYGAALLTARGHQVAPLEQDKLLAKPVGEWREQVAGQVKQALAKAVEAAPDGLTVDEQTLVDVVFMLTVSEDSSLEDPDHSGSRLGEAFFAPDSHTGGKAADGAEPVASGSTLGAHLAVVELLGEETVRSIIEEARTDLANRAGAVIDDERRRLERMLENPEDLGLRVGALLDAASAVNIAE